MLRDVVGVRQAIARTSLVPLVDTPSGSSHRWVSATARGTDPDEELVLHLSVDGSTYMPLLVLAYVRALFGGDGVDEVVDAPSVEDDDYDGAVEVVGDSTAGHRVEYARLECRTPGCRSGGTCDHTRRVRSVFGYRVRRTPA